MVFDGTTSLSLVPERHTGDIDDPLSRPALIFHLGISKHSPLRGQLEHEILGRAMHVAFYCLIQRLQRAELDQQLASLCVLGLRRSIVRYDRPK